jgi:hypothetical protein
VLVSARALAGDGFMFGEDFMTIMHTSMTEGERTIKVHGVRHSDSRHRRCISQSYPGTILQTTLAYLPSFAALVVDLETTRRLRCWTHAI